MYLQRLGNCLVLLPPVLMLQMLRMVAGHIDSTAWPATHSDARSGAARQIYGSNAQQRPQPVKNSKVTIPIAYEYSQPPDERFYPHQWPYQHQQLPHTQQRPYDTYHQHSDVDDDEDAYPFGVIVTHVEQDETPMAPAFDAMNRGGFRIPNSGSSGGTPADIYGVRVTGERNGDAGRLMDGRVIWPPGGIFPGGGQHQSMRRPIKTSVNGNGGGGVAGAGPEHHDNHAPHFDTVADYIDEPDINGLHPHHHAPDAHPECQLECLAETAFLCPRSCECVPMHQRCDGEAQCADGDDEEDCTLSNEAIVHGLRMHCELGGAHSMCPHTFACISNEWLCDGDDDCGDFSDETRCAGQLRCAYDQFECQNGLCVPAAWTCDGENDCKDYSDEWNCTRATCSQEQFHCADGGCVAAAYRCDGDEDCADGTDEMNCLLPMSQCPEGEYKCKASARGTSGHGGKCILDRFRCDGDNDCGDWSDEEGCQVTLASCAASDFRCGDGTCVPGHFRCDHEQDCDGDEDEIGCVWPPAVVEEHHRNGTASGEGGGEPSGGSGGADSETGLEGVGDDSINQPKARWNPGSGKAAPAGGDEAHEEAAPMPSCADDQFACKDGRCIMITWLCDGMADCRRAEDEMNCPSVCDEGQFTCPRYHNISAAAVCVHQKHICDGRRDCLNNEDELNCPLARNCTPSDNCEQLCVQPPSVVVESPTHANDHSPTPTSSPNDAHHHLVVAAAAATTSPSPTTTLLTSPSPHPQPTTGGSAAPAAPQLAPAAARLCACRLGYTLHTNGHGCIDIDECTFSHDPVCSQTCINTPGSFRCACVTGYVLRPDLRTCKALGGAVRLLMANRADIREMSLNSNSYSNSVLKGLHNVIALDYSLRAGRLFWSDISTDMIRSAHLNGTGIRTVVQWGLETPAGLAIDWVHELLFWSDSGTRRIEVTTLDGQLRTALAANELAKPRAVAVHPGEAMVFWTDWGSDEELSVAGPRIERAFMDGSERQAIVAEGLFWPNGLTVDYSAERIYWADAKHHVIESSSLEGTERRKILSTGLPHPFALTLFEDLMYWTDWNTKKISAAHKVTGKLFRHVHEGLNFPMDVHSVHASRQPEYVNRCTTATRKCSHLCLPTRTGRRCACPMGLALMADEITCSTTPEHLLIIARKKDIRLRHLYTGRPGDTADMIIPLDGIKSALALDWCARTDRVYWTDVGRSTINRAHLNGTAQETVIATNLISPAGLAVDWVTHKLYFSDSALRRIEVAEIDGARRRSLLVWQGLHKVRDIVLHPADGKMFWTDWGSEPRIEVAGMDGSNRKALVSEELQFPNGLAVDAQLDRLYFVDGGIKTLEYVRLDGSGRTRVIGGELLHPFGMDVYGTNVYWTDWDARTVNMANSDTGEERRTLVTGIVDAMDVRVFHRDRRRVVDPCEVANGGCSHLCLLRPGGYSCACPVGVLASVNGANGGCRDGQERYVVLAHRSDVRIISLDMDYTIDIILPLPPMTYTVALDVDRRTGELVFSDTVEGRLVRSPRSGQHARIIEQDGLHNVDGLAVDSVGSKVYWTDSDRRTIEVAALDASPDAVGSVSNRTVLVWQTLDKPRGIGLDYAAGLMFWTDWGRSARIERADMDGSLRRALVTTELGWPNGLTVDRWRGRVYWVDAQTKRMESVDYEGNGRKVVLRDLAYPYGVTISAQMELYWTDWNLTALQMVRQTFEAETQTWSGSWTEPVTVLEGVQGLMDVKVIDSNDTLPANKCGTNNGGCSHLCLRNSFAYSCACPTGMKLVTGSSRRCAQWPDEYLLVAMRAGIGRISLDTGDLLDVVLPVGAGSDFAVEGAVVLDYHYEQSKLFYADVHADMIMVVDMLNMSDVRPIVTSGLQTPNGLAVDWMANNVYWSDSVSRVIEVARLDGSARKTVICTDLTDPRTLIVYPKRGLLFWSDWGKAGEGGQAARIERSHMDGTGRKAIIDAQSGYPTGMAIDLDTRKLYWTDALQDRIDTCDLDGRRRGIFVKHTSHPYGLALLGGTVYWTNWYNKSIFRSALPSSGRTAAAKTAPSAGPAFQLYGAGTPAKPAEIRQGLRGALDMRAVSRRRQPSDANPCAEANGGCSHLCLFRGRSFVCACPNVPDGRPCRSDSRPVDVQIDSDGYDYESMDGTGPAYGPGGGHGNSDVDADDDGIADDDAQMWIIAIAVTSVLLVIVIVVIIVLFFSSLKRQQDKPSPMGSTQSVMTYANPNYNGTNGGPRTATIWKRFKYDKAEERVYEDTPLPSIVSGKRAPPTSVAIIG